MRVPDTRKILNCSGVRHSFYFSLNRQNVIIINSKSINWSDANECKDFKTLRKIPLESFVDLKVDYVFKQFFGTEQNKNITVVFLNAILKRTGRNAIKEISFMRQEFGSEHVDDKQSRLDILVKTQDDLFINVEIQLTNKYDMMKRTLYYWSRIYTSQLRKGMGYYKLRPTITINICNFSLFEQTNNYHSLFRLYDFDEKFKMDDVLEIHFIEINKFIKQWYAKQLNSWENVLARWLMLLAMVDGRKGKVYEEIYLELEELAMKDEELLNAFNVWQDLSQSPEDYYAYQSRLKYILDEAAKLEDTKYIAEQEGLLKGIERGMEQGIQQGIEQGIELGIKQGENKMQKEIVLKLLKRNTDIETIAELTGLTVTEIEQLKELLD